MRTSLVLAPACDPAVTVGASCVIDSLKPGRAELKSSSAPSDNGVSIHFRLKRAGSGGTTVNLAGLRAVILASIDGSECLPYESPTFNLNNGRIDAGLRFGGGDTVPPMPATVGSAITLCGDRVKIIAPGGSGDEVIAGDGLVRGPARPRTDIRGLLIANPDCDPAITPGADCAADAIGKATFVINSSRDSTDGGFVFRVSAKEIRKNGADVVSGTARMVVSMKADGGSCFDVFSPRLTVADGRLKPGTRKFSGAETLPPTSSFSGESLSLCGHRVQFYLTGAFGSDLVGIDGVRGGS